MFFYWKNEDGEDELCTHFSDDLILHGVIRDSVLVNIIYIYHKHILFNILFIIIIKFQKVGINLKLH